MNKRSVKRLAILIMWVALVITLALPAHSGEKLIKGKVIRVIDGDTLSIDVAGSIEKVRLIGIDCPEAKKNKKAYRDAKRSDKDIDTVVRMGKEAASYTRSLAPKGTPVLIETDVQPRDRYGRLLAYVWFEDHTMLNEIIVLNGYASPMTIPPNIIYAERFKLAFRTASERRSGLNLK